MAILDACDAQMALLLGFLRHGGNGIVIAPHQPYHDI